MYNNSTPAWEILYARGGADHTPHRRKAGGYVLFPPAPDRRRRGYCLVEPTCRTAGANPAANHIG